MYVCCFQSCTMHTLLSQLGYMGSFPWGKAAAMSYFTQPNQPHSPGGTSTQFCLDMFPRPLHRYMLCTLILWVQVCSTHKTLVFDLILFLRTSPLPPPPPPILPHPPYGEAEESLRPDSNCIIFQSHESWPNHSAMPPLFDSQWSRIHSGNN